MPIVSVSDATAAEMLLCRDEAGWDDLSLGLEPILTGRYPLGNATPRNHY